MKDLITSSQKVQSMGGVRQACRYNERPSKLGKHSEKVKARTPTSGQQCARRDTEQIQSKFKRS